MGYGLTKDNIIVWTPGVNSINILNHRIHKLIEEMRVNAEHEKVRINDKLYSLIDCIEDKENSIKNSIKK